MTTRPKDNSCNHPLCIRRITRNMKTGDYHFELQWRTSAGIITTRGWRWIRTHNRIQPPTCNGHHIFLLGPVVRAAIRNLFTRLMLEQKGIKVPPIGGRKKRVVEVQEVQTESREP